MVSAADVPADATAAIEHEMNSETVPEASPTRDADVAKDEKKDEQPVSEVQPEVVEEKAIFLNEELLDGPYHVETVNAEAGDADTTSANEAKAEGDSSELHPASEPGKRLGFPVEEWTEKATAQASALKSLVLDGGVAVAKAVRRLSGRKDDFEPSGEHSEPGDDKNASESAKLEQKDRGQPVKEEPKDRQLREKVTRWIAMKRIELTGHITDSHVEKKEVVAEPTEPAEVEDPGPRMKGRITVYTISGSQNCRAAKHFLTSRGLQFVEINLDAFPERRLDMEGRTEKSSVPQIFFNNAFIGGVHELNSMDLDELIKDVTENEAPADAPSPPVFGEDSVDEGSRKLDEYAEIVRRLRAAVMVKDRFLRYRMHSSCFVGSEAIDFLVEDQYCERHEAVELARNFASKHFLHSVTEDHLFEDGNYLYRFLEHQPSVTGNKVLNFQGATNDMEPLPAVEVGNKLRQLMLAILESKLSNDGKHVDHGRLANSEEFRRYKKLTEEFHRINLLQMTKEEKLCFFINIYNSLVIHAVVHLSHFPVGALERRKFFGDFQYIIGGYSYSLSAIMNGLLRANQRPPYTLTKPFGPRDERSKVALSEPEPLIHFALARGPQSSPAIRCYSAGRVDEELKSAASEFFADGGIIIDLGTKSISLDRMFKLYAGDFGKNEAELLKWILPFLDIKKSEQLSKLLDDASLKVTYQS